MADEVLRFDIIGKDNASGAFSRVGASARDMGANMDVATRHALVLDEALKRQATAARTSADATLAGAKADKILADAEGVLSGRTIEAELALKREAEAAKKSGRAAVEAAAENSVLADSMKKVADSGLLKPSAKGSFLALAPALIPLAGGIAAGIGAIGVSFGAAAAGAGLFGLAAKSVISSIGPNLAKLQALSLRQAAATTPAAKKSAEAAIKALTSSWSKGYLNLIELYKNFQKQWQGVTQAIAVPALTTWLGALTKGLPLLKTAVMPVADVFNSWGQTLAKDFSNPATMKNLQGIAAAFGRFSASQLRDVGKFIGDIALGVFHLGQDFAASGTNFGLAGTWLSNMGAGFLTWSKSSKARSEVQGFLHYLHTEGPVVGGILSNLGKILPGIFKGASATGNLELQAIGGLLSLIAKLPKGWQTGLTEAAGALLLLSKTGVLKVGFTIVGAAASFVKKLVTGATVDLGAAGMQRAGDTMIGAAAAMQKAADTMVGADAAGGGAAKAGGAAAGAGAGASAAEGGTMAALGAASVPVAVGIISGVAIAQLVNNDAASKASQAIASRVMKKNNLTPANIAAGKQTGGVVPGVPKSAIGSWQTYDHAVSGAGSSLKVWNTDAGIGKKVSDALVLTMAQMRQRNLELSATFRNSLIPDLNTMHANTPKVRADVQTLADSILNTGNRSAATRGDRQRLIRDLENAGVNAKTATGFVLGLQKKIDAMHGKTVKVGVTESGVGHFSISQVASLSKAGGKLAGPLGSAAGRLVTGGVPGRDSVLLAAMPGEVVVPTHMVRGGAVDHLRGMIPGFASGGYVGSPAGMLGSFTRAQESAFQARVTGALKSAMTSALRQSIRAAVAAASSFGAAGPGGGSASANAALARRMFPGENFPAWNYVAMRESGWSQFALNKSSGAYGIAQALPPTKYPFAGQAAGGSNPAAQISWMEGYMRSRYGGAAGAAAHELAFNWYDDPAGSWMPPGKSLAYNGTGRAEHLTPDSGMVPLLAEISDGQQELIAAVRAAAHQTGRALGDTLNGVARSSAYSSMYGSR